MKITKKLVLTLSALPWVACTSSQQAGQPKAGAEEQPVADASATAEASAEGVPAEATDAATAEAGPAPTEVTVEQVVAWVAEKSATVCDANKAATRQEMGVVPGAVLLASTEAADVLAVLPEDKAAKLVFYCGSEMCMAAPKAAKVALREGYTDVSVMAAGIKGWREAGQETAQPEGTTEEG